MEKVQSSFGLRVMAVVMTTVVTATDTPIASTHCPSALHQITDNRRGIPKHVHQRSLRHLAADQEESKKL